jgi:hypothetical protein
MGSDVLHDLIETNGSISLALCMLDMPPTRLAKFHSSHIPYGSILIAAAAVSNALLSSTNAFTAGSPRALCSPESSNDS